jgi:hypothetical protein
MFQFPAFPPLARYPLSPEGGFPHSDISGSTLTTSSPELFAGNHVLLRFGCQGIHRVPFLS